jgi:hypothetical protein
MNKFRKSITVFMAMLVLLSSTGFGFIEHQCMVRGKSVQFIAEKKADSCKQKVVSSCCSKSKALKQDSGTYLKKTECCKDNQKFTKLEIVTSQNALLAKLLKAMAMDPFLSVDAYNFTLASTETANSDQLPDTISFSSRFHGRSMRSYIQSFII